MEHRKSSNRWQGSSSGPQRKQNSIEVRRAPRNPTRKVIPLPGQITEDLKECFDLYDTE